MVFKYTYIDLCNATFAINFLLVAHCIVNTFFFHLLCFLFVGFNFSKPCYVAKWKVQVKNCIVNNKKKNKRELQVFRGNRRSKMRQRKLEYFSFILELLCIAHMVYNCELQQIRTEYEWITDDDVVDGGSGIKTA